MSAGLKLASPAGRVRIEREPHFTAKRRLNVRAKHAIALAALELVHDHMTVAFSAGTTTWLVARQIRHYRNLRFLTNSVNVALALEDGGWDSIIIPGGRFRTRSDALVGSFAERALCQLYTDVLFVGAQGVDRVAGLTTPNAAEAETNRVLVANARQVVAVADATKLNEVSLATFASLADVDVLITDTSADAATLEWLRGNVSRLIVADSSKEVPRDLT